MCRFLLVVMMGVSIAGCGVDAPPPKVVFENSLFKLLDVNIPPGATLRHSWSNGAAMVAMTDGAIRVRPSGKDWEATTSAPGSVLVAEPGEHRVENTGDKNFQMLVVENLRPDGGSTAGALAGKGITPAGESASFRVYDAQLADTNPQISHVHAAPALTVLIEGKILSQGPENKDKSMGEVASGLKQLDRPGQWLFIPAGEAHYVVRLGLGRARVVEIELRRG